MEYEFLTKDNILQLSYETHINFKQLYPHSFNNLLLKMYDYQNLKSMLINFNFQKTTCIFYGMTFENYCN